MSDSHKLAACCLGLKGSTGRADADTQLFGDDPPRGTSGSKRGDLCSIHRGTRATQPFPFRLGESQSCTHPLLCQCTFELAHGSDYLKHEPAAGRAEVKVVTQRDERDAEGVPSDKWFIEALIELLIRKFGACEPGFPAPFNCQLESGGSHLRRTT